MDDTLPPGKYYIGDPCYVFGGDWSPGICDVILDGGDIYRGLRFFAAPTAYGDGSYTGSNGFEYGVDAGLLGAIPLELVTDEAGLELGTVIEVKHGLAVICNEGTFMFAPRGELGGVTIDTGDSAEENWDEDEDLWAEFDIEIFGNDGSKED
jgi:hypothetical protein